MYKVTFNLEPLSGSNMVHFQISDKSPTIRASELKPMFDKYLTRVYEQKGLNLREYALIVEGDTTGYDHLDYQVCIQDESTTYKNHKDNYNKEFFFKRKNEITNEKEDAFYQVKTSPTVTFKTRYVELAKIIHTYFPLFLAVSYFGFRKGKGYGQFRIKGKGNNREKLIRKSYDLLGKDVLIFELDKGENPNKRISNYITERNTVLKQSVLKKYVKTGQFKDTSKRPLTGDYMFTADKRRDEDKDKLRFLRLLFGLAPQYGDYEVTDSSDTVNRMENPVKYYILNNQKVLVVIDRGRIKEIMRKTKGNSFQFVYKGKDSNKEAQRQNIPTLTLEEFNVDDVLHYIERNLQTSSLSTGGGKGKFGNKSKNKEQNQAGPGRSGQNKSFSKRTKKPYPRKNKQGKQSFQGGNK